MNTIAMIGIDPAAFIDLKHALHRDGYKVVLEEKGKNAIDLCLEASPDLIILDDGLADMDAFEACRIIQRNPKLKAIPILCFTARRLEADRLVSLELGTLEFIAKPYQIGEIVVRIKTHLRVAKDAPSILKYGGLEMDRRGCQVRIGNRKVSLTATEYSLLEHFMIHPGVVFNRGQLINAVWGYQSVVDERTVDVFISRLRRKLNMRQSAMHLLNSVRGLGYRFEPESADSAI